MHRMIPFGDRIGWTFYVFAWLTALGFDVLIIAVSELIYLSTPKTEARQSRDGKRWIDFQPG
jgi:hypothetical protein